MDDIELARAGVGADKTGRAYGRPPATADMELIQVGPGTRMGELMRRYWQPFALSSELNNDLPLPIRILGEDLVAFRDGDGKAGLMYPRCLHRGASLVYGKLEAEGIRCPYHGWLFDTEGKLLDTPCELDPKSTALHSVVRQPWHPVIEKFGIAFAYMGPPEKEPLFPYFPLFEELEDDEMLVASGGSKVITQMPLAMNNGQMDYNWLQNFENFMDPLHLTALHTTINGLQFNDDIAYNPSPCKFKTFAKGSVSWIGHWRSLSNDYTTQAIFQTVVPNIHIEGPVFLPGKPTINWVVPSDDTSFRQFQVDIRKKDVPPQLVPLSMYTPGWGPGRDEAYTTWTLEEKQRWQTDYLVQWSLGPVNLHSDEKLTTADAGVAMLRRVLKQQAALVAEGKDPVGSTPGEADLVDIYASTARLDPETLEVKDGYLLKTLADY